MRMAKYLSRHRNRSKNYRKKIRHSGKKSKRENTVAGMEDREGDLYEGFL